VNESTSPSKESATGSELSLLSHYPMMRKRSLIARAVERVVPAKSRFLGFVWILAVAAILLLLQGIQGAATQFYGIAESQLRSISFQHPVEIVDIPVVEGEQVSFDTRILEVRRYDLDIELQVIDEQINEIRARQASTRHLASAEIANLKAELSARQQALTTQIDNLESTHRLNQKLLASISTEKTSGSAESSPMRVRIDGLKAEQKRLEQLYRARIHQQQQKPTDLSGPGDARSAELEKNKSELRRQSQALVVRAPFAGSIGSVLFKRGEQVAAFSPVISIQGSHPQNIKGYIHEAVSNHVQIGQTVWVQSLNAIGDNQLVRGRVDSLGSRIVEYPERLKRNPLVSAWGREAIISIKPGSGILQGEKVTVMLQRPEPPQQRLTRLLNEYLPIAEVQAWVGESVYPATSAAAAIEVRIDVSESRQIEASGLVWYPPAEIFLLVSDEHSAIFEFRPDGVLRAQLDLDEDGGVDDLESISMDDGYLYLAASMSKPRKGERQPERSRFLRIKLQRGAIESSESIDLAGLLAELANNPQTEARTRAFLNTAFKSGDIDLESHAVRDNRLYLGFKAPLDVDSGSVILQLDDVNGLFAGRPPTTSIWLSVKLGKATNDKRRRLSDFVLADDGIYLLSVAAAGKQSISFLSHYNPDSGALTDIAEYPGLKAEGISLDPGAKTATIVFDGGGKAPSRWIRSLL